jgi:hypothetical protein
MILLIRTYAFFTRNKYVLIFLCSSVGGVIAYQLYVDTSQMLLLPFVTPPFTHGPCLPMSVPHSAHLLGFFIAPLLFDSMVTFMTVWRAVRIRIQAGGLRSSPIFQTFVREGVFYYILISIANLINGIFYLQRRQVISAINIPLSVMLGPVLACRLVLDLRERGSETIQHSEDIGVPAFASGPNTSNFSLQQRRFVSSATRSHSGINSGTVSNNVVLTTLTTIDDGLDQDLVETGQYACNQHVRDGDMKRGAQEEEYCCNPALVELGYKSASRTSCEVNRGDIRGIRVDVEKTRTTTM